eukprot:Opistho-2@18878
MIPIDLSQIPVGRITDVACDVIDALTGVAVTSSPITVRFARFPHKHHEVKIDNRMMGLVVDNSSFFPVGFYLDWHGSADFSQLMRTEINNHFNAPLPYRPNGVSDDYIAFMDALADVGGKVNFDMYGLGMSPNSTSKTATITEYVNRIKDHPALLSYYIGDEPDGDGKGLDPQVLIETYALIKELDPYHPVLVVLNCYKNPYHAIEEYLPSCDVMMTDPYCISVQQPVGCDRCEGNVNDVAVRADHFMRVIAGSKPLWIVLQAFGGGEHWLRQPTAREERTMTYLAVISGATGLLYFLENLPHQSLWSACGTLASEIASLAPALLGGRTQRNAVVIFHGNDVSDNSEAHVRAAAYVDPVDGSLVVVACNPSKTPTLFSFAVTDPKWWLAQASVEFEDRTVVLVDSALREPIDALGTRVYRLKHTAQPPPPTGADILQNGGFESSTEVGVVDGFATLNARTDTSQSHTGRFSMRLQCAKGAATPCSSLSSYPPKLASDTKYTLSFWARGSVSGSQLVNSVNVQVGGAGANGTFSVDSSGEWTRFSLGDAFSPPTTAHYGVQVQLLTAGPVWIDDIAIEEIR